DGAAVPDDDDAPVFGEDGQVAAEVDVGEHRDDDVHAAAIRDFEGLREMRLVVVVESVLRAVAADEGETFFRPGGAGDGHAVGARELEAGDAGRAAGAVDEYNFVGFRFAALEEGAVGGGVGDAEGVALRVGHILGQ